MTLRRCGQVAACDAATLRVEAAAAAAGTAYAWGCLDDPALDDLLGNVTDVQVTVSIHCDATLRPLVVRIC